MFRLVQVVFDVYLRILDRYIVFLNWICIIKRLKICVWVLLDILPQNNIWGQCAKQGWGQGGMEKRGWNDAFWTFLSIIRSWLHYLISPYFSTMYFDELCYVHSAGARLEREREREKIIGVYKCCILFPSCVNFELSVIFLSFLI